jgi:hypothetical protein
VGETTQNRSGTDLLEMCDELDLYFLTGRTMAAATCRGCSIVDHAIGTRPLLRYAASATTIDQDDVDVQLCGSDHLNHTAPAAHTKYAGIAVRSMRWRLSRLTSADCQIAYSNASNLTRL